MCMDVSVRKDDGRGDPARVVQTGRARALVAALVVAVLVAVPLIVVLTQGDDDPAPPPGTASEPPPSSSDEPEVWRAEAWRGVQVRVPADWLVGGAPQSDGGSAGLVQCGGAMDDGAPVEGVPYVGRPVSTIDECTLVDRDNLPAPSAPYVWLGSPLDVGEQSWDNGYTGETVGVGGQRVSVVTDDAALRAEILASAEAVETDAYGCPQTGRKLQVPFGEWEGRPDRLAICVYDSLGRGGGLDWSGEVGAAAAGELMDSLAGVDDLVDCRQRLNEQWVVLYADAGGGTAAYVVDLRCGLIRLPRTSGGENPVARLRPENVEPWALPGVRAYVEGPRGAPSDLAPYFRGLLG